VVNRAAEEELNAKLRLKQKEQKVRDFQTRMKLQYKERKQGKKTDKDKLHKKMEDRIKTVLQEAVEFSLETIKKKDEKVKLEELAKQREELMKKTEAKTKRLQTAGSTSRSHDDLKDFKKDERKAILNEIEYARARLALHATGGQAEPQAAEKPSVPSETSQLVSAKVEVKDNRGKDGVKGLEITITKNMVAEPEKKEDTKSVKLVERDFATITPVLSILGIDNYDKLKNMTELKMNFEQADEYQRVWKIKDNDKFAELLRFKIVQEIMSIEERRAARNQSIKEQTAVASPGKSKISPKKSPNKNEAKINSPAKK